MEMNQEPQVELAVLENKYTQPVNFNFMLENVKRIAADRLFDDPEKAYIKRVELRVMLADDEIAQCIAKRTEAVTKLTLRLEAPIGGTLPPDDIQQLLLSTFNENIKSFAELAMKQELFGYVVYDIIYSQDSPNLQIEIESILELEFQNYRLNKSGDLLHPDESKQPLLDAALASGKLKYGINAPSHANPYGRALLGACFVPWVIRQHAREQWAKTTSRFGTPFLIGKLKQPALMMKFPDGTLQPAKNVMVTALDAANRGSSIVVGADDDVAELSATVQSSLFQDLIHDQNKAIEKLILGQTLTSDSGKVSGGSYALGKVHQEEFTIKRDDTAAVTLHHMNDVLGSLWLLNEYSGEAPLLEFEYPDTATQEVALRDSTLQPVLSASGLMFSPMYFAEVYGLDDVYLVSKPPPPPVVAPPRAGSSKPLSAADLIELSGVLAFAGRKGGAVEAGDLLADQMAAVNPSPIDPQLLMAAVRDAADPADLHVRLSKLVRDPANQVEFARALRDAELTAAVMGAYAGTKRKP